MFPPPNKGFDIEILGFVLREKFIVLQTSQDYFENLTTFDKLKTIEKLIRTLEALHTQIEKESQK